MGDDGLGEVVVAQHLAPALRVLADGENNLVRLTAEQMKQLDDASAFDIGYPYDFIQGIQGRW